MPVRANSFPRELVRPVEGERIQVVECACQLESVKKKIAIPLKQKWFLPAKIVLIKEYPKL